MPRFTRLPLVLLNRPRLGAALVLGLLLFVALDTSLATGHALLLAFDLACVAYLGAIALMMSRTSPEAMRRRAELQTEGRWTVLVFSLLISAVVLLSLKTELLASKHNAPQDLLLAGVSIVLSWLFFSTVFTQEYAHGDHRGRLLGRPGLQFPGDAEPDYWDYLYFAMNLSMAFQTSDVNILDRTLRRVALLHSVVAFFFNVFIVALMVNVVAGVL
ncbi:MAG: DUF1345 domain-containing protein [Betaproteobacteria bacterium]|nr:DUF1345 domain-containing protein [Betaproteobacteria bacterium]MDE2124202.1 DUF1345 domain-containing protein [Betaproteobacteria bacterium]MDE2186943.1 DUF1345 domain-containing protein [Betaproteobacteria bacterium]MDE2324030.1 DUF1345 domain-containing protein [Betaproteobacteria bacterium]